MQLTPLTPSQPNDTLNRILDAAELIVREEGIDALSMRALAAKTGLTAPAAYRHFRGKDDILQAVILRGFERFQAGLVAARAEAKGPDGILAATLRYYLTYWVNDRAGFRVMSARKHNRDDLSGRAIAEGSFGDLPDLVSACAEGRLSDAGLRRATQNLAAALQGITCALVGDDDTSDLTERIESATRFLVAGLRQAIEEGDEL